MGSQPNTESHRARGRGQLRPAQCPGNRVRYRVSHASTSAIERPRSDTAVRKEAFTLKPVQQYSVGAAPRVGSVAPRRSRIDDLDYASGACRMARTSRNKLSRVAAPDR